jgi:hypothetical protein
MSIILWNRITQNVIMRGGRPWVFRDTADANANLTWYAESQPGLLTRLSEQHKAAGLPAPVIDLITVT